MSGLNNYVVVLYKDEFKILARIIQQEYYDKKEIRYNIKEEYAEYKQIHIKLYEIIKDKCNDYDEVKMYVTNRIIGAVLNSLSKHLKGKLTFQDKNDLNHIKSLFENAAKKAPVLKNNYLACIPYYGGQVVEEYEKHEALINQGNKNTDYPKSKTTLIRPNHYNSGSSSTDQDTDDRNENQQEGDDFNYYEYNHNDDYDYEDESKTDDEYDITYYDPSEDWDY